MTIGGFRIGFAGSAGRNESLPWAELSETIGREIMARGHRLVTGGCSGGSTQYCVEAAVKWLKENKKLEQVDKRILHVIPAKKKYNTVIYGQFLECKEKDQDNRRPVMASMMDVMITVCGGNGTISEGQACFEVGTPVVPIATTEGSSRILYKNIGPPSTAGTPYREVVSDLLWSRLDTADDQFQLGQQAVEIATGLALYRMTIATETIPNKESQKVFIIMPFGEEFDPLHHAIDEVFRKIDLPSELQCIRADADLTGELSSLFERIREAPFVIADFTGSNPNVLLEYGYAMGLRKKTIVLNQNPSITPTDIKHLKQIPYTLNDLTQLKLDLIQAIQELYRKLEF